jgi:hypothetical protein
MKETIRKVADVFLSQVLSLQMTVENMNARMKLLVDVSCANYSEMSTKNLTKNLN